MSDQHDVTSIQDLFIIGGGINGAGIAADAAGRGLRVTLCEQNDLASATSSASSKLIHGGLRYLEYYEFRLVREALREREILLNKAPHLIRPLRFVMPYRNHLRPAWLIRLGLFLYDHLGGRQKLPGSKGLQLRQHPAGQPLKDEFTRGFVYSDCWVDDARLVVLNALTAKEHQATVLTRSRCVQARREGALWHITVADQHTGAHTHFQAKVLINAAGPWVKQVLQNVLHIGSEHQMALVKGSHIILPRLYQGDFCYILQHTDKRVIFVIPYLERFTLVGTTDIAYHGDLQHIQISSEEINYLCQAVNGYFKQTLTAADVIASYAGVRPLLQDDANNPSAITRDYTLELDAPSEQAPLISVFGGKITTYRKLAEHALEKLHPYFPHMQGNWTAHRPLPGGDLPNADFADFLQTLQKIYAFLPPDLLQRYAHSYGTRAALLLQNSRQLADLGEHFGAGLYQQEVEYLINQEWAQTAEDILWRRTKLGLSLTANEAARLQNFLRERQ